MRGRTQKTILRAIIFFSSLVAIALSRDQDGRTRLGGKQRIDVVAVERTIYDWRKRRSLVWKRGKSVFVILRILNQIWLLYPLASRSIGGLERREDVEEEKKGKQSRLACEEVLLGFPLGRGLEFK